MPLRLYPNELGSFEIGQSSGSHRQFENLFEKTKTEPETVCKFLENTISNGEIVKCLLNGKDFESKYNLKDMSFFDILWLLKFNARPTENHIKVEASVKE